MIVRIGKNGIWYKGIKYLCWHLEIFVHDGFLLDVIPDTAPLMYEIVNINSNKDYEKRNKLYFACR